MNPKIGIERRGAWVQWAMLLAIGAIYLAFPTKAYFFDGIDFAYTIEQAPRLQASLTHPNHLIYNVVGWLFYQLMLGLGLEIRAVSALQILNSILSVVSAYVLLKTLKSMLRSTYICYCLTLLFAFSATWWKYSTDADAYIPSVLFLLISFYLALPSRESPPLLVALIYSIGLCFHQIAIVFFPVLLLAIFLQNRERGQRQRIINAAVFGCAATLITFAAYAISFYFLTGSFHIANFLRWAMSYAPDESFGFHALNNLGFSIRGHFRLFFGGRLNASSGMLSPLVIALFVILATVFLLLAFRVIRHFRKPDLRWVDSLRNDPDRRTIVILCLTWISVYLVFLFFLLAHHTYYRLFYLPAIIILAGLVLDSYDSAMRIARKYRLALFVAVLSLANFLMLIFPYSRVEKYPPLALAMEMAQLWQPGSVVYYGLPNADQSLVRYFSPGTSWKQLKTTDLTVLDAELQDAKLRGGSVWLETTAIDQLRATPIGSEWLKKHELKDNSRSLISKAHNIRFVQIGESD